MEFPEQSLEPIEIDFSETVESQLRLFETFKFDFIIDAQSVLKFIKMKEKNSANIKKFSPKGVVVEILTPSATFSYHNFKIKNGEEAFEKVRSLITNSAAARLALGILIGVVKFKNQIKVLEWEEITI